jgi:hypothetical protein
MFIGRNWVRMKLEQKTKQCENCHHLIPPHESWSDNPPEVGFCSKDGRRIDHPTVQVCPDWSP